PKLLTKLYVGLNIVTRPPVIRFSLASLLLLAVPVSLGSLWVNSILMGGRPIEWKALTLSTVPHHLDKGRPVLVFASPSYHAETGIAARSFADPRVRRLVHSGKVVTQIIEYADWD